MARFVTRKEAEGRKFRLRVFAGMFDFLATIGSLILIFACVALLASLVTWIRNDAKTTFASIEYSITSALIMPEDEQRRSPRKRPSSDRRGVFHGKGGGRVRVSWSSLLADVRACEKCALCRGRMNVVPGEGDPTPT